MQWACTEGVEGWAGAGPALINVLMGWTGAVGSDVLTRLGEGFSTGVHGSRLGVVSAAPSVTVFTRTGGPPLQEQQTLVTS